MKRSHGDHLTKAEVDKMLIAFRCGRKPKDVVADFNCSLRTAARHYSNFRGPKKRKMLPILIDEPVYDPTKPRFYKTSFEL